jgi:UDPglucose 6-dehydrogenase
MSKYKVGIIGNGFVGNAQAFAFSPIADILIYDIDPKKSLNTIEEVNECDFIFISVPTPMSKDGSQDTSYIEEAFENAVTGPIYIIKSTVLPGTTSVLQQKYKKLNIIFNPEFLTERTSKLDTMTQARIVLGGSPAHVEEVSKLYRQRFVMTNIIETDTSTAELIKYMNNTFFATKVSIMNEFKQVAQAIGANWEQALYGFAADGRVADSHLHVPGPDGKLGYGGTCFPKDVNALVTFAKSLNINLNSIEGGWKTNLEVRPEQDWQADKGRAVSK